MAEQTSEVEYKTPCDRFASIYEVQLTSEHSGVLISDDGGLAVTFEGRGVAIQLAPRELRSVAARLLIVSDELEKRAAAAARKAPPILVQGAVGRA